MGLRDELQADIAEALNSDLADAVATFTCTRKKLVSSILLLVRILTPNMYIAAEASYLEAGQKIWSSL